MSDERWSKAPERPMPPLPQDHPAAGNRTALVLVDSTRPEYADVHATTIAALHHWGVPYRVLDLSRETLHRRVTQDSAAVILAQEHLGQSIPEFEARELLQSVRAGTGLLSIDPWIEKYPAMLRGVLRVGGGDAGRADLLHVSRGEHFISAFRDENESVPLRKAVAFRPLTGRGIDLLTAGDRHPVLNAAALGDGRLVWWGVSPKVWLPDTLGHAWGLDDFFWRGLVWVARKPFVMKAMPPFVTMRFDDSGGLAGLHWMIGHARSVKAAPPELDRILSAAPGQGRASVLNEFEYVNVLNRFGWRPEVSLFVDQVSDPDWAALKQLHAAGGVQVSCHALSDGYDADGNWRSHFLTHEGLEVETPSGPRLVHCITPDAFSGGSGRFAHSIPRDSIAASIPRYRMVPWPDDVLEAKFSHLDEIWRRRAIHPGRTTNIHWRNPPSNCLAPLKRRRQTFSMWTSRYNYATVDPAAYDWRMLPYGDAGMCLDYMPIPVDAEGIAPTDFFNAQAHVFLRALAYDPIASDVDFFRCKKPPKPGLLTHHDLGLVAESIAHQARLGLQSLFFACPLTHEMNLATLTAGEWADVMADVERRLRRYPKQFVLYDTIAATARAKCETHLSRVEWTGEKLDVTLDGAANTDVYLYVFENDGDAGCRERLISVSVGQAFLPVSNA